MGTHPVLPGALEAPLGGCWDVNQRLGEEEVCVGDVSPLLSYKDRDAKWPLS